MKKSLFTNWNWVRLLRLVLGLALIVQGMIVRDVIAGLAGFLFSGMAVFNIGCCGPACNVGVRKKTRDNVPIVYEEIN